MRILFAGLTLLALGSTAHAQGLVGKTIISNPTMQVCNTEGRCSPIPGSINMYVSEKGQLFDYGSGNQGTVVANGGTVNGVRYTARGNSLIVESAGIVRMTITARGSSCTVSGQSLRAGATVRVDPGYSCSVVQGRRDR